MAANIQSPLFLHSKSSHQKASVLHLESGFAELPDFYQLERKEDPVAKNYQR